MFERYTERARKTVFFARYEASQFGSPFIETEHLLLGLLREDKALAARLLRSPAALDSIRKQVEAHTTTRERVSTSVDLPLSHESKRALAYGAEEAERLSHKHIGTEHLLLGLLREEQCFAARILRERGVQLATVREEIARSSAPGPPASQPRESPLAECRDLTQAASEGLLGPVVARQRELERLVQVLSRRTRSNPVLVGERGVGKTAIVEGLAQAIAGGDVPAWLADKCVLALDPLLVVASAQYRGGYEERFRTVLSELTSEGSLILFVERFGSLLGTARPWRSLEAAAILEPALSRGEIHCIGAATPEEYREAVEDHPWIERYFQVVEVPPLSEQDAVQVLLSVKARFEQFHGVSYSNEVIEAAARAASRLLPKRVLPGGAIDVMDEAGVRAKLQQSALPSEVVEAEKRIKFIVQRMENAIATHEFEKARFYSDEERKEREALRLLREKHNLDESAAAAVTREDVEEAVAGQTGLPLDEIRRALSQPGGQDEA